jgi:solute carrier family 13 (sodium-dependent dicarboxylate transporter), member 2/3/5
MATVHSVSGAAGANAPSPAKPTWLRSNWGLLLAIAALVAVTLLPTHWLGYV